eukprot:TCALIF_09343-PA protein Name:"Similar to Sb Serine proteinase stubble (Drosophila melanogaster)" AED:0.05 eAED:0.05 QI:0/0.8/0.81/1/0.9/0.81/11/167/1357
MLVTHSLTWFQFKMQLRFIYAIFLALTILARTNAFKFKTDESEKELGTESPILLKNPFAEAAKTSATDIEETDTPQEDANGDAVIFGDKQSLPLETKSVQEPSAKVKDDELITGDETLVDEEKARDEKSADSPNENEEVEGRFFLKDKLCALGLTSCEPKRGSSYHQHVDSTVGYAHGNVKYVQPVKVVPHGPPVPAIDLDNGYGAPKPSHHSQSSGYGAPKPSYNSPSDSYGPPKPSYTPTSGSYGAPKPSYNAPKPAYNAPSPSSSYGVPKPSHGNLTPTYGAPKPTYDAPKPVYKPSYNPPTDSYGVPKPSYNAPVDSYGAPLAKPSYQPPIYHSTGSFSSKFDVSESQNTGFVASSSSNANGNANFHHEHPFQTNFQSTNNKRENSQFGIGDVARPGQHNHFHATNVNHQSTGTFQQTQGNNGFSQNHNAFSQPQGIVPGVNSGHRQGRKDECLCVPVAECPTHSIVNSFIDYSQLIDPRTKKTIIEGENKVASAQNTDSLDLAKETTDVESNRARSLKLDILVEDVQDSPVKARSPEKVEAGSGDDAEIDVSAPRTDKITRTEESKRKRRDLTEQLPLAKDNESEDEEENIEATTRLLAEGEGQITDAEGRRLSNVLAEANEVTPEDENLSRDAIEIDLISEKDLEERKCPEYGCSTDDKSEPDFISIDDIIEQNEQKKKINLGEIGSTVSDKVTAASTSVKGGVDRFIGNIGNFFGINGTLQPTVGVSFGLPQAGPGYGGYAQNPLETGGAINPYYNSPNGLPVGAVDLNPLVSFQTTTNEEGELVAKPLINLHVTPNGCGIFGCDNDDPFNTKKSGNGGLLDFLFKNKNENSKQNYYQQEQQPNNYHTGQYDQFEPSSYIPTQQFVPYQPQQTTTQQYQSNYQPTYTRPIGPQVQSQSNPDRFFEDDSGSQSTVVHKHHHYHHHKVSGSNQGLNFGIVDDVYSRNPNIDETIEATNNVKRNTFGTVEEVPIEQVRPIGSQNKPKKGVRFPSARSLDRKKRSPDGVGHHGHHAGHHGHHDPNHHQAQFGHHDPNHQGQFGQHHPNHQTQFGQQPLPGQQVPQQNNGQFGVRPTLPSFEDLWISLSATLWSQRSEAPNLWRSRKRLCLLQSRQREYPWQVAILKKEEFDNVYLCGGSLIDGSHILTAAHCIDDYRPEQLRIRVGEWDVNNDSEFYPHVEFDASRIFIHDKFYEGNLYNDIAMVRINGYVDYVRNPHISPICLPDPQLDFSNRRCYVTGWGKDAFQEGNYQHVLKEVQVPVVRNDQCQRMLQQTRLGPNFELAQGFMCAGGEEGKDACKGDGGGPLVCQVNGLWQLAGIVSWGVGCGEYNVPGVYVKVSHYQDWIQEQLLRQN